METVKEMFETLRTSYKTISKQMAYLLRHEPSGMKISEEGFVELDQLMEHLNDRWPDLTENDVREVVENDSKGRYEIKGDKIRAFYGHSIDVNPQLEESEITKLYHGTTKSSAESILKEGLKPKGRQKVHLSRTIEDAKEVGRRRTNSPVVLEVDVKSARAEGVEVEKASEKVFVTSEIPPRFISVVDG